MRVSSLLLKIRCRLGQLVQFWRASPESILSHAEVNGTFLETTYLPRHNARFAQAPASAEDFHRRKPSRAALDRAYQLDETRVVSNDRGDPLRHSDVQVTRQSGHAPARSTVLVRENAASAIEIRYRGRPMHWTEIPAPAPKPAASRAIRPAPAAAKTARAYRHPSIDHPWRRRKEERDVPILAGAGSMNGLWTP